MFVSHYIRQKVLLSDENARIVARGLFTVMKDCYDFPNMIASACKLEHQAASFQGCIREIHGHYASD